MPEISARDLRRLQGLDERLRKAQEEKRREAVEARSLRTRLETRDADARAAEEQVRLLLEENRRLAEDADSVRNDLETAAAKAAESRASAERVRAELADERRRAETAEAARKRAEAERARLAERLSNAEAQLADSGTEPVVPAGRVAELVDGLVEELRTGMSGLQVNAGELRLRVGMGAVGDRAGFVVPTAGSSEEQVKSLHEITLRFDRRIGADGFQRDPTP